MYKWKVIVSLAEVHEYMLKSLQIDSIAFMSAFKIIIKENGTQALKIII